MPPADEVLNSSILARVLAYGEEKTKKTWWLYTAAAADYNVIHLCNEDGGYDILQAVPKDWRSRITVIDCSNEMDRPVAADFATLFFKGIAFLWDEQRKDVCWTESQYVPGHSYYYINPKKLTSNEFVGLDSWTELAQSSLPWRYCLKNNIDFTQAEEKEGKNLQDHYKWSGNILNWMLSAKNGLKCHLVIIGHATQYEKIKETNEGGRKVRKVVASRMQPVSSSGPHGMVTASKFSDILRFFSNAKSDFRISTWKEKDIVGGSRLIPPNEYLWKDLTIPKILEISNLVKPTGEPQTAFRYFPPGAEIDFEELGLKTKKLAALAKTGDKKPKSGSLADLMKPKETAA